MTHRYMSGIYVLIGSIPFGPARWSTGSLFYPWSSPGGTSDSSRAGISHHSQTDPDPYSMAWNVPSHRRCTSPQKKKWLPKPHAHRPRGDESSASASKLDTNRIRLSWSLKLDLKWLTSEAPQFQSQPRHLGRVPSATVGPSTMIPS